MKKTSAGFDINAIVPNMVDRRKNVVYDRVKVKAGMMLPDRIVRFNIPVGHVDPLWGEVKTYADTNMLMPEMFAAPYDLLLKRFLFLFQPSCSVDDRNAFLANYFWEFQILEKIMIRQPGAVGGAESKISTAIENFGKGSHMNPDGDRKDDPVSRIDALAPGVGWDWGEGRYIPPLVHFRVTMHLSGKPFQFKSDLDLYICLDGVSDFPVQ